MARTVKTAAGWQRGKPVTRANAMTTMARLEGLDEAITFLADRVISQAKAIADEATSNTPSEQKMVDLYKDSLVARQVEPRRFGRKNAYPRTSRIPVAVVVPENASVTAQIIEYGTRSFPGFFPLTKATYELGGDVL